VTPGLFQAAPTPAHLAALPHATVLELIRSVGLAPGKTKNIIGAAKMLVEKFGGQVSFIFIPLLLSIFLSVFSPFFECSRSSIL
jgi:endonuclease III